VTLTRKRRLSEVVVGDKLRVLPGDGPPVNGVVVEGKSAVDEPWSPASRCRHPRVRQTGSSAVPSMAQAPRSSVRRSSARTVYLRIVVMVADAQRSRAPNQKPKGEVADDPG
jgi:Cu+-exporting ATPase